MAGPGTRAEYNFGIIISVRESPPFPSTWLESLVGFSVLLLHVEDHASPMKESSMLAIAHHGPII